MWRTCMPSFIAIGRRKLVHVYSYERKIFPKSKQISKKSGFSENISKFENPINPPVGINVENMHAKFHRNRMMGSWCTCTVWAENFLSPNRFRKNQVFRKIFGNSKIQEMALWVLVWRTCMRIFIAIGWWEVGQKSGELKCRENNKKKNNRKNYSYMQNTPISNSHQNRTKRNFDTGISASWSSWRDLCIYEVSNHLNII